MTEKTKLYILVRSDLPPGAQCAQACHAMRAFSEHHPEVDDEWYQASNNLVVLNVGTEPELLEWFLMLRDELGATCAPFREPDFDDQLTAIAVLPMNGKALAQLPLALRAA